MLVDAHRVAVGETEDFRNSVRVEEIVDIYPLPHVVRLLQYSDPSEASNRLQ